MLDFRDPDGDEHALFSLRPHDQFGCTEAGAWYALRWHGARPGGVILLQDDAGLREVALAPSDGALAAAWRAMTGDTLTRPRPGTRAGGRRRDQRLPGRLTGLTAREP